MTKLIFNNNVMYVYVKCIFLFCIVCCQHFFYFIFVNILQFKHNKLYNFLTFLLYIELYSFEALKLKKKYVIASYHNWLFKT